MDRVLLTGGSGFLGKTLSHFLVARGYDLVTVGRSASNTIHCDISTQIPKAGLVDWVIHNAGKAHSVPKTEEEALLFTNINVNGTKNLLLGIEKSGSFPRAFIFISSVAVYGLTSGEGITEEQPLNAVDPYGKSKIEAEKLVAEWCGLHQVACVILRLPLVAGPNPPGNLNTMIKALKKGYYFGIGESNARKSMVLAEDVASIIPHFIDHPGIYHLTDGIHPSFRQLEKLICKQLDKRLPLSIPLWLAKILGITGDFLDKVLPGKSPITTSALEKITSSLTFDDQKARAAVNWHPQKVLDGFIIS